MISKNSCTMYFTLLWLWLWLWLLPNFGASQTIIKNLPGFSGDLPFKLETGYVGVGNLDELQLFYYFFESEKNPENDPLMLWFTGGPRCSSLAGIIEENGPLSFNYERTLVDPVELVLRPYSWTKIANIIFLDIPVGTGFSYSTTPDGYNTSDIIHATRAYEFLQKWLINHPKFLQNPLYIAGDSYSGKIVPIIVEEITDGIEAGIYPRLNLKGYVIGNPFTNANADINSRVKFAHRLALISDRIYESLKTNCNGEYVDVDPEDQLCLNSLQAFTECTERLVENDILTPACLAPAVDQNKFSILGRNYWGSSGDDQICTDYRIVSSEILWANDINVHKALNVREGTKDAWIRCNYSIPYIVDVPSTVDYHRNLTQKSLRALVYSGDHDLTVPYLSTLAWVESLNLTIDDDWKPWFSHNLVAGYTINYSNKVFELTYATVKGAGHTPPRTHSRQSFDMIRKWLDHSSLL